MGAYTNIRGWIEIPRSCKDDVIRIIESTKFIEKDYSLPSNILEMYISAWVVQADGVNCEGFAFYGAEIKTHTVDMIKSQVTEIAKLREEGEDYEIFSTGLFHLDEDGTYGYPPRKWIIGEGTVVESDRN